MDGWLRFLDRRGGVSDLIRAHDWAASPLGPAQGWPQSLQTLVSVILGSNQPMFIVWGSARTLIYNDAYGEILADRHPAALARDFLAVWDEIRDDLVPIVEQAYHGEPVHMDDIALRMRRRGRSEEAHFAFSYTPVRDEQGDIAGFFCACVETTAQVLSERRAAVEREQQRRALQQMPGFAALLIGPEHRFEYVNDAYVRLVGERPLVGLTVREALPEIEGQGYFELLDQVFRTGEQHVSPATRVRVKGEDRYVDLLYYPIRGEDGRVIGIFAGGYDITEQVRGEARFRAVQETSVDGFMLLESVRDNDGRIVDFRWTYANQAAARIVGRDREWFIGRLLLQEMPGNRDSGLFDTYARIVETGEPWTDEVAYGNEGLDLYLRISAAKVEDGIAVSFADLSERRQAELMLQEANERLQLALDAGAIVGTWVWDVPSDRFTADARFARSFDLDEEVCRTGLPLGQVMDSIHPEDRDRVAEAIDEALYRGGRYACQYRVRQAGGEYRWIEANGRVELDADGKALRFPGVLLDIEGRRAAEAERDRALALLQTFTEAVPGVVYAKDLEGRMLVANRGTTELIGKPPEEYLGKTDAEFLDDKEQARIVMENDRRVMTARVAEQIEEDVRRPDGRNVIWLSTKMPLFDKAGQVIGLIGASIDITARKQAEAALEQSREELRQLNETLEQRVTDAIAEQQRAQEALRQSQKLESMGQLTGGVAHDFNNLLTPIIGSLDLLQKRGVADERQRRLIEGALQAAERAKTLVQRLLAFARRQPLQAAPLDLPKLIEGMAELVASTSGPRVKVVVDAPVDLPAVMADQNQLEMAILNLAVNARDAMPDGGQLTIAAEPCEIGEGHRSKLRPGAYVRLSVSDTGVGMDEATLARAIEPFFSTKGVGKGTGLGLSMVHGLTAQLGGALTIRSRPGVGTTVELWLPLAGRPAREEAEHRPALLEKAAGTALLVDDEDLVRASTAEMLADLGYAVVEAESAEKALSLIEGGVAPDFVVTDHLMPGMTGTDLARLLIERGVAPVLIISGYAEDEGLGPDLPRLTKPFRESELAAALADLTRARRSSTDAEAG